jgi:desulfoferrodoxin (superoxide reductase-like protein)
MKNNIVSGFSYKVILLVIFSWVMLKSYPHLFELKRFKSKTLIKPKIELFIENNKVDTLYVYEFKNS